MTPSAIENLASLYERDETAWLDQMAQLAAERRYEQMDWGHLSEYFSDMAIAQRREVLHRLTTLLAHLLKWEHQSARRSRSWELTIQDQREELQDLLEESATLRRHASKVLDKAYHRARRRAAGETGLAENTFPARCPMSLPQILGETGDSREEPLP